MATPFNKPPKPSLLKEREELCFNPPQGYNAVHFNRETGGLVLQHQQHNLQEIESELVIAKTFADQNGDLIELLPERKQPQGVKAPDARHNKKFKGKIQTINRRDWNNGSRFSKF